MSGKRVVILGFARQGRALARYLATHGAQVLVSDALPESAFTQLDDFRAVGVRFSMGGHPLALLEQCDELCLSGGVPVDLPIVQEAVRRGIPLTNDAQRFLDLCPAPVFGITGSAGKTTTTVLAGEMLRAAGVPARVGGNIGNPLIAELDAITPRDVIVMELSSFQLEQMTRSPQVACITNVTPNHLDRHASMQDYVAAKRRIIQFQDGDGRAVLGADDAIAAGLHPAAPVAWFSMQREPPTDGAWLDSSGNLRVRLSNPYLPAAAGGSRMVEGVVCHRRELQLMGDHNVLNVLAAALLAAHGGAKVDAIRNVAVSFRGVDHRLQLARTLRGVRWYDDSIATAPERLMAALRCFDGPVVLLCGGRDKHLPWQEAVDLMAARCRHVVFFGELGPMVAAQYAGSGAAYTVCAALAEGVQRAAQVALPGDVVLLSPGGTSFDEFRDFAERGDRFKQWVTKL